ncbi:MAG: potassium channel family protein [Desulfobacterales bacterium]|nr:potassium channel family protein [Desulfobacterales bacterium]
MIKILFREKYTILLAALLVHVIISPFMAGAISIGLFLDLTFSLVMFSAVFSISRGSRLPMAASVLLMLPCLFIVWWIYASEAGDEIRLISFILQAVFVLYITVLMGVSILKAPKITRDVISAAIVVYLFVALFFANLYLILEFTYPGSFTLSHEAILEHPEVMRYFSMVTLSTLGYGDISPVSPQAQTMASVQAIFGQFYLAVLIARLVSMHGTRPSQNTE